MSTKTSTASAASEGFSPKKKVVSPRADEYLAKFNSFFPSGLHKHFAGSYSPATTIAYTRALAQFADFAKAHGALDALAVTSRLMRDYHESVRDEPFAQLAFVALRQAYRFCEKKKLITRSPITEEHRVSRITKYPQATVLTAEQLRLFFDCFPVDDPRGARDHAVYATIFYTCSRLESVAELKREAYQGDRLRMKNKIVPVHPALRQSIDRYLGFLPPLKDDEYIFQSFAGRGNTIWLRGQRISQKTVRAYLPDATEEVRKRTALPGSSLITSDTIRDSSITIYLQNGGNLRTLMALADQKSLDFLLRFMNMNDIQLTPADIQKIRI